MSKPNLFVIGAMRAGTTALHSFLNSHPEIFMSAMKEPTYFVESERLRKLWVRYQRHTCCQDRKRYLELFENVGDARFLGESSTNYSKRCFFPEVAERIAEFNPHARLIYIMRDPIDRTISHYWHMVEFEHEFREPMRAVLEDPQYLDVSYYAWQLEPYFRIFGPERIKTLTCEQLRADPIATMGKIFAWLGIDSSIAVPPHPERAHVTPERLRRARNWPFARDFLRSRTWHLGKQYVPSGLKRVMDNIYRNESIICDSSNLRELENYLRPIQQRQTEQLSQLLGRKFPEWSRLGS